MSVLPAVEEKARYVDSMFRRIASTYDRTNRLMTFGLDQEWRRYVVETVAPPVNGRALDVGTGTGDFLPLLASWMPGGTVVGVDFCLPMMQAGIAKRDTATDCHPPLATKMKTEPHPTCNMSFVAGDALQLPFPDDFFDAITTGFTIRNVTDIDAALREMWRVARPGGVMACLEVARPHHLLLRMFHQVYFRHIVPCIGGVSSGNRLAYVYLHQSAWAFPAPDELAHRIRRAGWQHVQYRLLSLGAVAVHVGVKL
jgi:demethylmenaquinone methyltransferase/2-methoxy-6-polyprenyl-1,4-benzoquinol methylase